jgi:hypothetical protein
MPCTAGLRQLKGCIVGYELRREVRDLLPRGGVLTDKECRLILELADHCNETTRQGWPGADWLAEVCDIPNPKRVGEFFASIGRKWFELRVELGKDKNGNPFYATPSRRVTYRIPTRAELVAALSVDKVPPTRGLYERKVPPTPGPKVPGKEGPKVPPTAGTRSPQRRDPSPQGFPHKEPQEPPPPTPSQDVEVVDTQILEEAEDRTSSLEHQIQKLTDEIRQIRPSWPVTDVRAHVVAATSMLGQSFDAAAEVARRTARDPTSARPSRITASGNPHLQAASTAYLIASVEHADGPRATQHPNAHTFEAKPDSVTECRHCPFPQANGRHRVGDQGGYISQRQSNHSRHRPYLNPPIEEYYRPL